LLEATCDWNTQSLLTAEKEFPSDEEPHALRWETLLRATPLDSALLAQIWPALAAPIALTTQTAIHLAPTAAGRIPVITAACRPDFENLLRTIGYRGRSVAIPPTVGAMFLNGVPHGPGGAKDRLILLNRGGYAGLSATAAGFTEEAWASLSLTLREQHELIHYALLRLRGSLAKNLTEELIADADALRTATGQCPSNLLEKILGLTNHPPLQTSRFTRYLPPDLKATASAYQILLRAAVRSLSQPAWNTLTPENRLLLLARLSLEDLAFGEMEPRLQKPGP
jgi:hypothetical protein